MKGLGMSGIDFMFLSELFLVPYLSLLKELTHTDVVASQKEVPV